MGSELYTVRDGKKIDAHLHDHMLDNQLARVRAAREAIASAVARGIDHGEVVRMYGHDLKIGETADAAPRFSGNKSGPLIKPPVSRKGDHKWFDSMTRQEQEEYVRHHPHTVMKPNASNRGGGKPAPKPNGDRPGGHAMPTEPVGKFHDKEGLEALRQSGTKNYHDPQPHHDTKTSERVPSEEVQKPGGASRHLQPADHDRARWPQHIRALNLPPAWTDVHLSHDPHADLQAIGKDAKGRSQYVYSEAFAKSQAAAKFHRVNMLHEEFGKIDRVNRKDMASDDPRKAQHAQCMHLIMHMGLRPGGDGDTGADKKAYGASTLRSEHVVRGPDGRVRLQFTGKKGVALDLPVHDRKTADMLTHLAKAAGPDAPLFPHVSASSLLDHSHGLGSGGFKTKDFRTHKGTSTAHDRVSKMPPPQNEKEYRKAVRDVAVHVSKILGNTPSVALASYICPAAFAPWHHAAPQGETAGDKTWPRRGTMPGVHYGAVGRVVPARHDRETPDDVMPKRLPVSTVRLIGFDPRDPLKNRK